MGWIGAEARTAHEYEAVSTPSQHGWSAYALIKNL
jgi:hypothetical protein